MSVKLKLERRGQEDKTHVYQGGVMASPLVDEDYWAYRVRLSETQAIVGFPKYGSVGIGFAVEDNWNTNLPYRLPAEEIFAHIAGNKGDDSIRDDDVLAAIKLVQQAVREDRQS